MKKVFISFCSKNRQLAKKFIEFLQLGMGLRRKEIFCTAFPDNLQTGEAFIEKIRKQMLECDTVILLITEDYLKSSFCLVEMGAAWGLSKQCFPLLAVNYEALNGTPLLGIQMRKLDDAEDLSVVYDELHQCEVLEEYDTAEFHRRAVEFASYVKEWMAGEMILYGDESGYYEAEIKSVRELSHKQYRCYGIRGHIDNPPDGEQADSDWLFYWGNAFPDLMPGERVRFKTSKSKVNVFPDLGRARNIFPDDLKKIDS